MKKMLLILSLMFSFSALAADAVILDCTNSWSQPRSLSLSKGDYDFLMFGNNTLESKEVRVSKTPRTKKIFFLDKLDSNIETAIYRCVVREATEQKL